MANDDPQKGRALQVVAAAANEPEADLIVQRLAQAGITATSQRTIGSAEWGTSGSQYIYVEAAERERAREILKTAEGISEEELARLSEQPSPATPTAEQDPSLEDDQDSAAD
jgi:ketol-acid reductoisomerase